MAYQYLTDTGVIIADTAETLATVEGEYKSALGQELNTDPATPQGRLISTEVTARDSMLRNNADVANQLNPRIASGTFLDAIWALTGGARRGEERTGVPDVVLGGIPGTIIPATVRVVTAAGDPFEILSAVTIGPDGTALANFRSVNFGPIPAPVSSFRFDPQYQVLGWETVDNPNAGILGRNKESDVAARIRRQKTLALQGSGLPEAVVSRLYATEGVKSLSFRENVGDSTAVIDGINMISHSMFACVDGGSDLDVATVIYSIKGGGCGYNGNTVTPVVEPSSGQTYNVKYSRPDEIQIQLEFTVRVGSAVVDPATAVRNSAMLYAEGEIEGEQGFVVGVNVSPFELGGAVNIETPGIHVVKVRACAVGGVLSTDEVPISLEEVPRLNINNIAVILL